MTISEKYLEALKTIGDWVIVSEWAKKFAELYPDEYAKAEEQARNQKNDTTGLREIAARISSRLSTGGFEDTVEIDDSERPRRVRYVSAEDRKQHVEEEIADDIEPLTRQERIEQDSEALTQLERYRMGELETIARQLNRFFGLDFEVDHAKAILNPENPGKHHPDNLQILTKAHNGKKNKYNWQRFSIDEQIEYIEAVIRLQTIVAPKFGIELESKVLENLMTRLREVF